MTAEGENIESVASAEKIKLPEYNLLSQQLNSCSGYLENTGFYDANKYKEILWQLSIALWPKNVLTLKNYAFFLEWNGYFQKTKSLYVYCIFNTHDQGCIFQNAFASYLPAVVFNESQAFIGYYTILYDSFLSLHFVNTYFKAEAYAMFRELQINQQYIGYSPGILSIIYHMTIKHIFPQSLIKSNALLEYRDNTGLLQQFEKTSSDQAPIRVGIFSSDIRNSSPGLCFLVQLNTLLLSKSSTSSII
jgi:hypothetical protein